MNMSTLKDRARARMVDTISGLRDLAVEHAPDAVRAREAGYRILNAAGDEAVVRIYDEIWFLGVNAQDLVAELDNVSAPRIRVEINSPGGDVFEGIAIYNLLRAHKAKVSVEVLGWAASAASIIAMAGDDIRMGRGTFMMVHNVWGLVIGNRHDLADASELFKTFDAALADIYQARTGRKLSEIEALMDGETFMDPQRAVKEGFADGVDDKLGAEAKAAAAGGPSATQTDAHRKAMAKRIVEASLAKSGYARSERTEIFSELSVALRDAGRPTPAPRDAGGFAAGLSQLLETVKSGTPT